MNRTIINPYEELDLKIYGYTLPEVPSHEGYIKIGDTNRQVKNVFLNRLERQDLILLFFLKRLQRGLMVHGFMISRFTVSFNRMGF